MYQSILTFIAVLLAVFTPAVATAWDFSCSPRTSTEVELAPPPNIMMMLDRSGSMGNGDRVRTCKVCEDPDGTRYEVQDVSECSPRGLRWEENRSSSIPRAGGVSGYTHTLVFDNLPSTTGDLELDLEIIGDSGGRCEYYDITIDGVSFGTFNPRYGGTSCRARSTSFVVPETFATDNQVVVVIQASGDNNSCDGANTGCANNNRCDGVDALCNQNVATGTLSQNPRVYWGSQAWVDPCGSENKWEQAVRAIDMLTLEAQATTPQQAHFGFGYYHNNATSQILNTCLPSNHGAIMSSIGPLFPTGGTPTALGIRTAGQSSCVAGAGYTDVVSQTDLVPQNSSNHGYDQTFRLTGIPAGAVGAQLQVEFWGDFGSSCEFAYVFVDGVNLGHVTGATDCNSSGAPWTATFELPPSVTADGEIDVVFDTRNRFDRSSTPACVPYGPGVNAYCNENGARMTVRVPDTSGKAAATILINDGAPTKSLDGRAPYHATIHEACEHRSTANMYVLGLGTGTDEDFNNIAAAAGGTGECRVGGTEVDPCEDPANWAALRGRCTGSFQADDGAAMLAALAEITAEIACTYPVDFSNSGTDAVPPDATNAYDYLTVDVLRSDTGAVESVYNVNSPYNPNPGVGWEFASSERKQVRMSPTVCNLVNAGAVRIVETQLACLCQETPGEVCSVPGASTLGVCPEGTWSCIEGTDICEPDTNCCVEGELCNTGLEGICATGRTVCNGNVSTCQPINEPSPEVCDGLDNDCDGIVDELDGTECTIAGKTGRCAAGVRTCAGTTEVCAALYEPMPEICNGLDDDCDGVRDNMRDSWDKEAFASYPLTEQVRPLTCDVKDLCSCPEGTDDHAGVDFNTYIANWDPVCVCGAGVEWDDGAAQPDESDSMSSNAGCSSAGGSGPALMLVFFGLMIAGRRRRD